MADIFDATRRKISKHISSDIAPDVLKTKNAEFKAKAIELANEYMASDKFRKSIARQLEWTALEEIQKYFHSKAFKNKCHEVAKGMVK